MLESVSSVKTRELLALCVDAEMHLLDLLMDNLMESSKTTLDHVLDATGHVLDFGFGQLLEACDLRVPTDELRLHGASFGLHVELDLENLVDLAPERVQAVVEVVAVAAVFSRLVCSEPVKPLEPAHAVLSEVGNLMGVLRDHNLHRTITLMEAEEGVVAAEVDDRRRDQWAETFEHCQK